jgi:hypothetical protein
LPGSRIKGRYGCAILSRRNFIRVQSGNVADFIGELISVLAVIA